MIDEVIVEDDELYVKLFFIFVNFEMKNDIMVKVLGMNWDIVIDEFFFNLIDFFNYGMILLVIKCFVLKLLVKIFD